jgi:hypothetical protein
VDELRRLGVLSWQLNSGNLENDPQLAAIRKARGYSYQVPACADACPVLVAAERGASITSMRADQAFSLRPTVFGFGACL